MSADEALRIADEKGMDLVKISNPFASLGVRRMHPACFVFRVSTIPAFFALVKGKISPQANPPVCKLMDYGKFRFEQGKREKEARKNQHVVEIKEIRMSPGIDVGDFNVKLKNAQKFLTEGNRVKVSPPPPRTHAPRTWRALKSPVNPFASLAEVPYRRQPGEGFRPFPRARNGPHRYWQEAFGQVRGAVRRDCQRR